MDNPSFDLVVIGAGPGGYTAAIRASQLGMKVACVEKEDALGGTCLRVGCIPSKALLDSSHLFYETQHAFAGHGIKLGSVALDLPTMLSRKDKVVAGLTSGVAGLFRKNKVEDVRGMARILSPAKVEVKSSQGIRELNTKKILIASGSEPIPLPGLPFDGKFILSSTEALSLPEVPKRLLVIGGGAIGLEMGSVWSRLGSEVLVVEFLDRLVPAMDVELTTALRKSLEKQGMRFQFKAKAESAKIIGNKVIVQVASETEKTAVECDKVLVAVGRRPFLSGLGAKEAGVEIDPKGRIVVDAHFCTRVPGIYAIGDVIAGPMLAHKASEEGVVAVERMAGVAGHVNYLGIPNVVYTHPEVAAVGLTEEEAKAQGHEVRIGKFPFLATGRARALGDTEGFVKMVGDAKTDRVLGVHIIGPRASDLIAEAVLSIELAASTEDIARASHAHPTLAEALKEAALAVDKRTLNI